MKPIWLLGSDVARSPSPAMHNAALAELGCAPVYQARSIAPESLDATLDDAERTCRGIQVTAPYKVRVAQRYRAVLDDDARAAGAVNTVLFDEHGHATRAANTDVAGLLFSWRRAALHIEGRTLALVGAGGAARAVVVAARQAGARAVVVHARKMSEAVAIVNLATAMQLDAVATVPSAASAASLGATVAVIAATGLDDPSTWLARCLAGPGAVHDLRYGPAARAVRDAALSAGHVFSDGTLMLLAQAQLALSHFAGAPLTDAATTAMRRALTRAL